MKIKISYMIFLVLMLASQGCEKLVAVDPPKNQLVTETVFQKDEQAVAALTGIYSRMYRTGSFTYYVPFTCGLSGDELTNWTSDALIQQIYQNAVDPTNTVTNEFWNGGFNIIYQANAIIEGCRQSNSLSVGIKTQIEAEAHFLRAFWHFYLVNFFGEIPIITSTNYQLNALASRRPIAEVYQQIKDDLHYASIHLNEGYVDLKANVYDERVRPNRYAALALLARVQLYLSDWENAIITSGNVIDHPLYDTVPVENAFLKNNKEAIWQILAPTSGSGSLNRSPEEGRCFTLANRPPFVSGRINCTSLSDQLVAAFESGDKRWLRWVGLFEDASTTPSTKYYYPAKYKETQTTNPAEYSTILRLSEQYLIRAEAYARQSQFDLALGDLNLIRARAGLEPVSTNNMEELMTFIRKERQTELFVEWGHRWLDLKRWRLIDNVMEQVAPLKGGTWNTNRQRWPLPQRDIESNPNLVQNNGYN